MDTHEQTAVLGVAPLSELEKPRAFKDAAVALNVPYHVA
jgi:hypothetical protein